MRDWPTLTVVTISFNQARFLEEAIGSVLDQGYPRLEYLILDGGSSDGSVEIIRRHAHRLAFWQSAKDGGAAAALNTGFRRSKGALQGYLNSDDRLAPGTLARVAEHFVRNPQSDIVYGDIRYIDEANRPTRFPGHRVRVFKTARFDVAHLAYGALVVPQQGSFCRREVFERLGGFVEENTTCWDGEFFADAAIAGCRFDHLPGVLGDFRMHTGSLSASGRSQQRYLSVDRPRIAAKWAKAGFPPSRFRRWLYRGIVSLQRLKRYATEPAEGPSAKVVGRSGATF